MRRTRVIRAWLSADTKWARTVRLWVLIAYFPVSTSMPTNGTRRAARPYPHAHLEEALAPPVQAQRYGGEAQAVLAHAQHQLLALRVAVLGQQARLDETHLGGRGPGHRKNSSRWAWKSSTASTLPLKL